MNENATTTLWALSAYHIARYNNLLIKALVQLLAEKGIATSADITDVIEQTKARNTEIVEELNQIEKLVAEEVANMKTSEDMNELIDEFVNIFKQPKQGEER